MRLLRSQFTAGNALALIALVAALGTGAAFGLPGKSSVDRNDIKKNAITSKLVKNDSLTGADIAEASLGEVPNATFAEATVDAETVSGHDASCPAATVLIRGLCFDASPRGPVQGVFNASDDCVSRGGYLPSVLQLRSTRGQINLGTGAGTDARFTDSVFWVPDPSGGIGSYSSIGVSGAGGVGPVGPNATLKYHCVYYLVR